MSTSSIKLEKVLNDWLKQLTDWAFQKKIIIAAKEALKLTSDQPELYLLEKQWAEGDFSKLPPIVLLNQSSMKGAAGAYSISKKSIYLNIDWLERSHSNQILKVLTEELGHHLDSMLNSKDTPGDEGELFSALLHSKHRLNDLERYEFEIENDHGQIILGKNLIDVENATVLVTKPVKAVSPGHTSGEWRNLAAFAALKSDGSVVSWGDSNYGGDSNSVKNQLINGVSQIFSSSSAFAALKDDGSIITWGSNSGGGNSSAVSKMISSGVQNIFSTQYAFAALKDDGSVVTWGDPNYGGDSSTVKDQLKGGIKKIFSNNGAFAALKDNGSVVTWGDPINGGDSLNVANQLSSDIKQIYSNANAFAAINSNGSVITWGNSLFGSDSSEKATNLASNVREISSSYDAFAALKTDGSVVTWGESTGGGNSSSAASTISSGVKQIFSNYYAFAALKEDNSVVSWGGIWDGGDSSVVASRLSSGVNEIIATGSAFTALKSNGSVAIWGDSRIKERGSLLSKLGSNVKKIYSNSLAFAALMNDGSVVTWGDPEYGGDSSTVKSQLTANVTQILSTSGAFAALKEDGSVISWGDQLKGGNSSSLASQLNSGVVGFADPFADDWLIDVSTLSISLNVSEYRVLEDSNTDIIYTFARKGVTIAPLSVSYSLTGTATNGTDYKGVDSVSNTKTIIFPAGSNIATVTISPVADKDLETDETIILTLLEGTGYSVGSKSAVEVTLINDELPIITLSVSPSEVKELDNNAINYLFTRSGPSTSELTVNYTVSGTAKLGIDYSGIASSPRTKSVTFTANSSTANVTILPTVDTLVESNESITLSLIAGTNYNIGTKSGITATILEASTNPLFKPPIPNTSSTNSGVNTNTKSNTNSTIGSSANGTTVPSASSNTTTGQKPTGEELQINTGYASFSINGRALPGEQLTISKLSDDPEGNGIIIYEWQTSTDGANWNQVGKTSAPYSIPLSDKSKYFRAFITYVDGKGFSEAVDAVISSNEGVPKLSITAADFSALVTMNLTLPTYQKTGIEGIDKYYDYVELYPMTLLTAFYSDYLEGKIENEAVWGKKHWQSYGNNEGRALPDGKLISSIDTIDYGAYVENYGSTLLDIFRKDPRAVSNGGSMSMFGWGKEHYNKFGKAEGREILGGVDLGAIVRNDLDLYNRWKNELTRIPGLSAFSYGFQNRNEIKASHAVIVGTDSSDKLTGQHVYGQNGNDVLCGSGGMSILAGGFGDDLIVATNGGLSTVYGGPGSDVFQLNTGSSLNIRDFRKGADMIQLGASISPNSVQTEWVKEENSTYFYNSSEVFGKVYSESQINFNYMNSNGGVNNVYI